MLGMEEEEGEGGGGGRGRGRGKRRTVSVQNPQTILCAEKPLDYGPSIRDRTDGIHVVLLPRSLITLPTLFSQSSLGRSGLQRDHLCSLFTLTDLGLRRIVYTVLN